MGPVVSPPPLPVRIVARNRSRDPAAQAHSAARMKAVSKPKRQPKESVDPPETKKESPRKEQVEPVAGGSNIETRPTRKRKEASKDSEEASKVEEQPRPSRLRGKKIPLEVDGNKRQKTPEVTKEVPPLLTRAKTTAPETQPKKEQ